MPTALPLFALALLTSQPTPPPSAAPTAITAPIAAGKWSDTLKGTWEGAIKIPGGSTLAFTLTVAGPADAAIAIPQQGLSETPLADVAIDTESMKFKLVIPDAPPVACPAWDLQVAADAASASGTMLQGGGSFESSIKRLAPGETGGPSRPQTPKAPFPYTAREVSYESADGAAINGTLTLPDEKTFGKGPYPAALLITGSGVQDRDETLFAHKPFLVIADALTRAGVAVLRVDDRGWKGAKDPLNGSATTETYVGDACAGVEFLATQPEINAKRIGLIGHSEGALIAPSVAARKPDSTAFIVLMAGPGVTGAEVLERQMVAVLKAKGLPDKFIALASARQKVTLAAIAAEDEAAVRESMREAAKENDPTGALTGAALDAAVEKGVKQLYNPWMRHFLARDPRVDLRRTTCPVLILNGGKDAQVVPSQNVPEIVKALLDGGNTAVTVRVFPDLNHLFQPCHTGGIEEYGQIETTVDPTVLETMTRWIAERAKQTAAGAKRQITTQPSSVFI